MNEQRNEIDMKDFQWFGATLSSAGENGPVVVSFKFFTVTQVIFSLVGSLRLKIALTNFSDPFAPRRARSI